MYNIYSAKKERKNNGQDLLRGHSLLDCAIPLLIDIPLNVDRLERVVGTAMGVDCAVAWVPFRCRRLTSLVVLTLALAWTVTVVSQGND